MVLWSMGWGLVGGWWGGGGGEAGKGKGERSRITVECCWEDCHLAEAECGDPARAEGRGEIESREAHGLGWHAGKASPNRRDVLNETQIIFAWRQTCI